MSWIRRKVKSGSRLGTKIGFPTLNFNVGNFDNNYKTGVYSCQVRINGATYQGALYFGHRLTSSSNILEIYVLDFNKKIYGQYVSFRVLKKVRSPKYFKGPEELKKQITKDIKDF